MTRFGRSWLAGLAALGILVGTLGAPAPARAATTRHVPGDYATIQAAINAAAPGDTVLVAPGMYAANLTIDEEITLDSSGGADVTTIDGGANGSSVIALSLEAGEAPVVRGFTITNGWNGYGGAGVYIAGGEPVIEDNRIVANHGGGGSGIYAQSSAPTIQDNVIADNTERATTGGWGGGIALIAGTGAAVRRNVITGNSASSGGGIALNGAGTSSIDANVISDNTGGQGGGIAMINASFPVITNNLITRNAAPWYGGGGIYWGSGSDGGAPALVNNTIADNTASSGDAVLGGWGSGMVVRNNVFSGTSATGLVACPLGMTPTFTNNDAWNPGGPEYSADCPAYTGANGNVSVNPGYVDPVADDYHLRADSPLIDAGTNTGAPATDRDGDSRPFDGDESGVATTDIGFDESVDPVLVDPVAIDFGTSAVSLPSSTVNVTVTNLGAAPFDVDSVTVTGTDATDFDAAADGCTNATLAADAACTVGVVFTATATGDRTAELTIAGPAPVGTRTVRLSGAGLDPLTVAPTSINFGSVPAGGVDTPVTVTVTNAGAAAVSITSVTVSGTNATEFPINSQTCTGASVAQQCTISVGFTPKATGARSATLSITGPEPVGTRTVALSGAGTSPSSGVSWGTVYPAGSTYTWNAGNALGRTVQSGTQRLHAAYATDRVGGAWAKDGGPYVGVYYTRASSGSTWSTPKRLNSSSQHAPWLGLAASGSRVYVTWVSHAKWNGFSPTAPRVLYVRRNTNHGGGSSWQSTTRLTGTTGRVDYPVIAASGYDVHIAYTDSLTGSVRVATSRDRAVTFTKQTIATTTLAYNIGYSGLPAIAVDGSTVAVAWLADNTGAVKARVSTDRGATWGSVQSVGGGANGNPSIAVLGSRIAVSWTTADEVVVRQRLGGTWESARVVANLGTDTDVYPYSSAVKLNGTSRIGVAWAHRLNSEDWTNLRWAESANGGAVWFAAQTVASYTTTSNRVRNDWPSIVWATAGTRYVLWNGYNNNFSNYRQYLRKGSGTPVGPTSAAVEWIAATDGPPTLLGDPARPSDTGSPAVRTTRLGRLNQ